MIRTMLFQIYSKPADAEKEKRSARPHGHSAREHMLAWGSAALESCHHARTRRHARVRGGGRVVLQRLPLARRVGALSTLLFFARFGTAPFARSCGDGRRGVRLYTGRLVESSGQLSAALWR
jgi:hypothetical protein